MRKVLLSCLSFVVLLFTVTVSSGHAEVNHANSMSNVVNHVESFVVDTYSKNGDGNYQRDGYKEVNSITKVTTEGDLPVSVLVQAIEDFYDSNGNYIKSVIKSEESINDYHNGKTTVKSTSNEFETPQVLNGGKKLSDHEEKENVITHIKNQTVKLPAENIYEVEGLTLEQYTEIKRIAGEAIEKEKELRMAIAENDIGILNHHAECPQVQFNVEMCGAFDNYYNHNVQTGDFTVQTLVRWHESVEPEPNKYQQIEGNVSNKSDTGTVLSTFKNYINSYEELVQKDMDGLHWAEVAGWASVLASWVIFAIGVATGPAGWGAYALQTATALTTFIGMTSTSYGTYQRLSYSRNAAIKLEQAMDHLADEILLDMHWLPIGSVDEVNGF